MTSRSLLANASSWNRLFARLVPSWTRQIGEDRIFSWALWRMLAARLAGLLDKNPWQQPSEYYDVVFVDSEFARRMLIDGGYDATKIALVGRPILDSVYERLGDSEWERRLYADLGIPEGSPFALFNVEPSFEHRYATRDEHWQRFHSLMEGMQRTGLDVVLSLHPLCDPKDYRFVEDQYGFTLSEQHKIGDLYPYCGVSVSFPCSTNLMAEMFAKPLVIYDWVGLTRDANPRSDLFRLPGATYAYDAGELVERVAEVISAPGFGTTPTLEVDDRLPASERIVRELAARFGV